MFAPNATSDQRDDLFDLFVARRDDIVIVSAMRARRLKAQVAALAALAAWRETIVEGFAYRRRLKAHVDGLASIMGGAFGGAAPTTDEELEALEVFDTGVGFVRESEAAYGRNEIGMMKEPQAQLISEAESFLDNDAIAEVIAGDDEDPADRATDVAVALTKLRKRNRAWPVED